MVPEKENLPEVRERGLDRDKYEGRLYAPPAAGRAPRLPSTPQRNAVIQFHLPMEGLLLLRVLLVLLLVAANAFFVAAEFSLVSVRATRVQQLIAAGRLGARTVERLQSRLDEMLAGVQLGVTLASLGLGWAGEATLAWLIERCFGASPALVAYRHLIAIVVAFALITYLHTTLGELVPKSLALQRTERVALAVAGPLEVFVTLTRPFVTAMKNGARLVLRLFGVRQIRRGGGHSPEELKLVVTASRRFGLLPAFQEEIIQRALELGDVTVREIMVPRPDIFSLPANLTLDEALRRVVDVQHSRIPIYDEQRGPEFIIGLLHFRDLTRWMRLRITLPSPEAQQRIAQMKLRQIMRHVLIVPETKLLPDLLDEFKQRKRHLAVVVDEFGSTVGVVTAEDVLEQLVGEIEDEFDIARPVLPPGATMVLDGAVSILDLDAQYQIELPREQGYETLAGFLLARLQRLPRGGESVEFAGRKFTVLAVEGRRIAKVKVETAAEPAPPENA
jgi:CBS domain containing-hemolysin-like protein